MRKSDKYIFEMAKERYDKEIQLRGQINHSIALLLGVLSIIGGLLIASGYFIKHYGGKEIGWLYYTFLTLLLISWLISVVLLLFCFFREYKFLLTPDGWVQYRRALKKHYKKHGIEYSEYTLIENIKEGILKQYIDYSSRNARANFSKIDYLTKAKIMIIITLLSIFPLFIIQIINTK